jgi:hypothetical protein
MKSRINRWSGWSAVVLASLICSFPAQANLLLNGGFEEPVLMQGF